jgi:hypothetical protein
MLTAMSSSGVYSPDLGIGARLACCCVYPLQVFPVIVHAIDVPIKIGSETRFLSCRLDILSAMSVISFVPETKAARMRSQRHLDHDVHIDRREERVVYGVLQCQLSVHKLFGGHNHTPSGTCHYEIVSPARCNGITPAVGLQRMKDRDIRADRWGDNHVFARVEGVFSDQEIRTVREDIGVQ